MQRVTITLDDDLGEQFDAYLARRGYANRSEAMRDLIRARLEQERLDPDEQGDCMGVLSYVYNHHERELAKRVTEAHHARHDLSVSTLHVHLDHENCLESVVLQGEVGAVRQFADGLIAQPGIRHGQLHLVPVEASSTAHVHSGDAHAHPHRHLTPRT